MFKKILVPLDGSELAERSLVIADHLVKERDAEMILLRVPIVYSETGVSITQGANWDRSEAERYLQSIQARREHLNLTVRTRVVEGDEAQVIVETAVSEKVDLLVMSAHGRSGFGHAILGSVAEQVLRSAPCVMLVARADSPFNKMLITLDGSSLSEQAIAPGLEVAQRFGAAVTLLRVCPGPGYRDSQKARLKQTGKLNPDLDSRLSVDAGEYLDRLVKSRGLANKVQTVVRQGPVAATQFLNASIGSKHAARHAG